MPGLPQGSSTLPRHARVLSLGARHKTMPQPALGVSQNQASQLIERVSNLHAHQNERCDHEIKTKMHEGLAPNISCGPRSSAVDRKPNSILIGDDCFDFEPRFDSSSMIFGNLCSRRAPVNLFCNAFGECETRLEIARPDRPPLFAPSRREDNSEPTSRRMSLRAF